MDKILDSFRNIRLAFLDARWFWGDIISMTLRVSVLNYIWGIITSVPIALVIALYLQYRQSGNLNVDDFTYPLFVTGFLWSIPLVFVVMLFLNAARVNRDLIGQVIPTRYVQLKLYNPQGNFNRNGVGVQVTNNNSSQIRICYGVVMALQHGRDLLFEAAKDRNWETELKVFQEYALPWRRVGGKLEAHKDIIGPYESQVFELATWNTDRTAQWCFAGAVQLPPIQAGSTYLAHIRFYTVKHGNAHDPIFLRYSLEVTHTGDKLVVGEHRGKVDEY